MAASKFTEEVREALLDLFADGVTTRDAAREVGVREKTIKGWLTRGRREDDGPYAVFANRVEQARQLAQDRERPMDPEELRLVVSRAARNGSVQAMKLYWEMTRGEDDDADETDEDGFAELDELEPRRQRRAAS